MVRTRGSMSPSPEVSGSKKKVEKAEEVSKNMVGSGLKVVESDKEKKNKNLSISKRSGVSEATSDDRCSKKLKSVVEDEDDFDSECDEAPIVLPKKLKFTVQFLNYTGLLLFVDVMVWDFYLKPEDRFCGKIIYWFDVGVIAEIKGRLNAKQLTMFQESCFGHFLDLEECNMQSQEKNKKKVVDETKESDDDFEDVRQPRVDVDKTGSSGGEKKATISLAVLDELKDSVLGLVVRQVGLECVLKEFRKEVDEKFALLEENLKGYIDRKVGEDLTFYFDTKFSELKDLIKDSIANSNEDEDEDDGGGGGNDSPRNLDDISDDVEPTVKGDGEDAGEDAADVKDGEDCVGGDGDVYKEIKNISEMSVKEVDSQDFAGLCSLEKDMPNFDILGSLLGQNETVAMVEDEVLGSDGGNVGGVEGVAEKVSAGTDDGFSESVMAVINQKVDDVCHAYEVKKIMDKIKVCESPKSKRAHKPNVVLQSPYRNDFGSSGSNEKMKKKNVKGQYAFNSGLFDPPHELQQKAFDEWFCVGFKDENNILKNVGKHWKAAEVMSKQVRKLQSSNGVLNFRSGMCSDFRTLDRKGRNKAEQFKVSNHSKMTVL
ncbi:hypothetical protein F8388_023637 [Cannabis sativa]|uniref:Uncharacterized protein n=1 Tax=Cannabis sativa TaxID=3483 RepID=A0A7J6GBP4_CANSA|nr:hypothetical protein F8388_023637 [Cannabis sativa]